MAGGPVSWLLKLQPIVTVSSLRAEYVACFCSHERYCVEPSAAASWIGMERTIPTAQVISLPKLRSPPAVHEYYLFQPSYYCVYF